jgi:nucleoside-diphosphate-sugar epimerase
MLGVDRTVAMSAGEAIRQWRRSTRRPWLVAEAWRVLRGDARLRDRLLSTREGAVVRRVAQRTLPAAVFAPERWVDEQDSQPVEPELATFKPEVVRFLASRARARSDKARELLDYRPVFGLEAGMRLVEEWARWEGLLA